MVIWKSHVVVLFARRSSRFPKLPAVRKYHSMKFGRFSVTDYILIEYGKGKFVSVMPVKEQEFAELLEKRMFAKKIKATEAIDPVGSQADES